MKTSKPVPEKRKPADVYFAAHRPSGLQAQITRDLKLAKTRPAPSLPAVRFLEQPLDDDGGGR
jgi:hypothetical protein